MKLRDCPYLERLAEATAPKTQPRGAAPRRRTSAAEDSDDTSDVAGRDGNSPSDSPAPHGDTGGTARRSR